MKEELQIKNHYKADKLLNKVIQGLTNLGKSPENVKPEDLAPLDEFHVRGLEGTVELIKNLNLKPDSQVLDVGSGMGGAARYAAKQYRVKVTGIDLSEEYVTVANEINRWFNLEKEIMFFQGNANRLPFESLSFDSVFSIHVGMNIKDKNTFYSEIARVMKTGGTFGIFDFFSGNLLDSLFPVPWADDESVNYTINLDKLVALLENLGFSVTKITDVSEESLNWIDNMLGQIKKLDKPPAIGLHLIFGQSFMERILNMEQNLKDKRMKAYQLIITKK